MPKGITEKTKKRKELILDWARQHRPVTVRQIFYRLSTLEAVDKSERGYKVVGRLCTQMRLDGEIPFSYFADNTRWMRRPRTYNTIQEALELTAQTYRKSLWQNQTAAAEIWLEKEALAGVIYPVTSLWDVPLMVVKGYPSVTFLHTAASQMKNDYFHHNRITKIFYLGDRDPSGLDIFRNITERIPEFAQNTPIIFSHVAVTTRTGAKMAAALKTDEKNQDSRAKDFEGESVELDAILPSDLRQLVTDCIEKVIDSSQLEQLARDREDGERECSRNPEKALTVKRYLKND